MSRILYSWLNYYLLFYLLSTISQILWPNPVVTNKNSNLYEKINHFRSQIKVWEKNKISGGKKLKYITFLCERVYQPPPSLLHFTYINEILKAFISQSKIFRKFSNKTLCKFTYYNTNFQAESVNYVHSKYQMWVTL